MLLKKGDKKVNVRHLQAKLNITQDGDFGPLTEKAVIKYQLSNGLPVTGMVDSDMWALLFNKPYNEIVLNYSKIRERAISEGLIE